MYLPPEEVTQVRSLLSLIGDPKSAQKLLDKLAEADASLDAKKADIDKIADEARNTFEAESRKALHLQEDATQQLASADERFQQALIREASVKKDSEQNVELRNNLIEFQQKLNTKEQELSNREASIAQREFNTSIKETALTSREDTLASRQQDLDARFAKLREAAQ